MNSKVTFVILTLLFTSNALSEIPKMYKEGIKAQYDREAFASIILFEVNAVTFVKAVRDIYSYRIDTRQLNSIKGEAPKGNCYFIHTEGEWPSPYSKGDTAIVILVNEINGKCGVIEPGYTAPGTKEYIEFFESIVSK